MNTYLMDPLAPLIIRSGRPFDNQAGADAARFPPPSTLAGALRTAHAGTTGKPFGPDLAKIPVAGPLPVKLDESGKVISLLVPKPADAHYFWNEGKTAAQLVRAAPKPMSENEGMDLPDEPDGLLPVQLAAATVGKPSGGPRWWAWNDLMAFRGGETPSIENLKSNGWAPPEDDLRTHVVIERISQSAEKGKLFQTAGLTFLPCPQAGAPFPEGRISLIGSISGEIGNGVITLGGERRLSAIAPAPGDLWPTMPANLAEDIHRAGGLCLTLLTPALFAGGWHPSLTGKPFGGAGLKLRLRAAALERWLPHSGWDLAQWQPRAGRKMVPAGAVYWFEVLEASDKALRALWLAPVSDHEQDRRDGFGLAWTPPRELTH
ncbi:MAG: type III-B CRISPR module-associated Cmr3 family protein [Sulfuricellaceae bacterium]